MIEINYFFVCSNYLEIFFIESNINIICIVLLLDGVIFILVNEGKIIS